MWASVTLSILWSWHGHSLPNSTLYPTCRVIRKCATITFLGTTYLLYQTTPETNMPRMTGLTSKKKISAELLLMPRRPKFDPWKRQHDSPFPLSITLCTTSYLQPINFQSYGFLDLLLISFILTLSSFLQSTGLRWYAWSRTDHKMYLNLGIHVKLASIFSDHRRLLWPVGSVTSFHSAHALLSISS